MTTHRCALCGLRERVEGMTVEEAPGYWVLVPAGASEMARMLKGMGFDVRENRRTDPALLPRDRTPKVQPAPVMVVRDPNALTDGEALDLIHAELERVRGFGWRPSKAEERIIAILARTGRKCDG